MKVAKRGRYNKHIILYDADSDIISAVKCGWCVYREYSLNEVFGKNKRGKLRTKKPYLAVDLPNIRYRMNDFRCLDERSEKIIDDIDKQITELQIKRQQFLQEKFLEFRLAKVEDFKYVKSVGFASLEEAKAGCQRN